MYATINLPLSIHTNYGYYALVARIKRSVPHIIQLNLITIQQYIKGSLFVFIVVAVVTITRVHYAVLSSHRCLQVNSLFSFKIFADIDGKKEKRMNFFTKSIWLNVLSLVHRLTIPR